MVEADKQRIADLERDLRLRDERIRELKDEVDENRELVRELEEHEAERDEYLETFITAFGLTLNAEGMWENGEFIAGYRALFDQHEDLRLRFNRLVGLYNRHAFPPQPVGRPIAASEVQRAEVLRLRKRGVSLRGIAEETSLGLPTVRTIVDKLDGSDRTSSKHRRRFGLEPKRKDWRPAAIGHLPKRATAYFERSRELARQAKGLK